MDLKLEGHSVECMYLRQSCSRLAVNQTFLNSRVATATCMCTNTCTWDFPDVITGEHGRTPYKWFNINRIGPGKRINGKNGKAETIIFWPYYSGKCRAVGAYSPRRNHGRATASRQTEKTVDTRHWRVDRLQIHSAKGDVTGSSTMEKKDIGVVVCCRQPSSKKVD